MGQRETLDRETAIGRFADAINPNRQDGIR
jgi:hypothetical protein